MLKKFEPSHTALIFSGGRSGRQIESEAEAMYAHYINIGSKEMTHPKFIALETKSTNTIENVHNAALKLIESRQLIYQSVNMVFVSNDYHLRRIFEIHRLLSEKSLIRALKEQCRAAGLTVEISQELSDHYLVPYPHLGSKGQLFVALDRLTIYRVYLEGVVSSAFSCSPQTISREPYLIAKSAIRFLSTNLRDKESYNRLLLLETIVDFTVNNRHRGVLEHQLYLFNTHLTILNRILDPENGQQLL